MTALKSIVYGVVEKDIPIPAPRQINKRYPYDNMEPGDSFLVPADEGHSAYIACKTWGKDAGMEWARRKVAAGVRIWRTK